MDMVRKYKGKKSLMVALAIFLIAAGSSLIYFGFRWKWQENSVQRQLRTIYSSQVASQGRPPSGPDGQPSEEEISLPLVLPDDREEADERFDISRLRPLGILKIPRIKIEAVMVEGVTANDLRFAVGHFPGTGLPGQEGNLAIAGHRNFITGDFFGHLDKVEPGDELIVEYYGRTYTYEVTEVFVVEPRDTWVLKPGSGSQITLVTCTPPRLSTHRLIVRGTLQKESG